MNNTIKKKVAYYIKKYQTNDPFTLAEALGIEVAIADIGTRSGCYMVAKCNKWLPIMKILKEMSAYLSWRMN